MAGIALIESMIERKLIEVGLVDETLTPIGGGGGGGVQVGFASGTVGAGSTVDFDLTWHPGTTPFVFKSALIIVAPTGGGSLPNASFCLMHAYYKTAGYAYDDVGSGSEGNNAYLTITGDNANSRTELTGGGTEGSILVQREVPTEALSIDPIRVDAPTPALRMEISTNTWTVSNDIAAVLFG